MAQTTAYDEVRYSNFPYAQTHPDRLRDGRDPARARAARPVHRARAGDRLRRRRQPAGDGGGDAGHPRASGWISPPTADRRRAARRSPRSGSTNVEFRQGDVRELTNGQLGEFDYIVAHGVYGWIPEEARDALLATIKASLAPDGIAYVSFNAQPGGYFRRMLRDAGLWHARDEVGDGGARPTKAQELYRFLNEQRVSDRRHLRRAARARGARRSPTARSTGSCTTT